MDIFNTEFDDIDNKLCNFLFYKKKFNFVNIMDYYIDTLIGNTENEDAFNVDFQWL